MPSNRRVILWTLGLVVFSIVGTTAAQRLLPLLGPDFTFAAIAVAIVIAFGAFVIFLDKS